MPRANVPNLARLEEAAEKLGSLLDELVLVGGCAAGLLVTDPGSAPIRPTQDVDMLVEASTYSDYHAFGQRLVQRGFTQGQAADDPICRWKHGGLVLDVMPLDETVLGFSNRWYREAMRAPLHLELPSGPSIAHIDAPHFLATKLAAFRSRGEGDYLASSDLEDVVVVIDGRASIEQELSAGSAELRSFIASELKTLLAERYFLEALPGYFAGEDADGRRTRLLMDRLQSIANPDDTRAP